MTGLEKKIEYLKQKRNAVILAHNYQLEEIHKVADYIGDSFYLSKVAANIHCEVLVFCGVRFMAETAKILSPDKIVLLPENDAGCPLADTITGEDVRSMKSEHQGVPVVCYINSSAEVKAESDVCCTSSNAVKIISLLSSRKVIFVPDENLGDYVSTQLPDKELILWKGNCLTHAKITPWDVQQVKNHYPHAKFLIHPECTPSVVKLADFVGSTSEIIHYAESSEESVFVIGTEVGVVCTLKASRPEKTFYLLHPGLVCPNMKKTRIQSVYQSLLFNQYEIQVEEAVAQKAKRAITQMLEMA